MQASILTAVKYSLVSRVQEMDTLMAASRWSDTRIRCYALISVHSSFMIRTYFDCDLIAFIRLRLQLSSTSLDCYAILGEALTIDRRRLHRDHGK